MMLLENFVNPPSGYRPVPLWIWNGEVSRERITEMLKQFQEQGMGGVFIHPRPGLVTEYLSPAWFEFWGFALEECKRLGLGCHIYDENSYPTGFAGGHVMADNPLCTLRFIGATLYPPGVPVAAREEVLGVYAVSPDGRSAIGVGPEEAEARGRE
ncbi:MAG: hypothetical protein SNJ84_09145, partial [Verrucomicrobiia bacterium]